jgi:hypothetical protein
MTGTTPEITIDDARALVSRAGFTLRSRPFPGSDPEQAASWQQDAEAFLHSELIQRALESAGVTPQPGAPYPTDDLVAFLGALDHALGQRRDNPVAVLVATVVAGAITGFLAGRALDAADVEPGDG